MDREEILKKAQSENPNKDEMNRKVSKLAFRHFELIMIIPLAVFGFIRVLNHESIEDLWAILFGIEAFPSIVIGIKEKRIGILVAGIFMLALTVLCAVSFFKSYGGAV